MKAEVQRITVVDEVDGELIWADYIICPLCLKRTDPILYYKGRPKKKECTLCHCSIDLLYPPFIDILLSVEGI